MTVFDKKSVCKVATVSKILNLAQRRHSVRGKATKKKQREIKAREMWQRKIDRHIHKDDEL